MTPKDFINKLKNIFSSLFSKSAGQGEDEIDEILTGKVLKGEFDLPNFGERAQEPDILSPDEAPVGFEYKFKVKLIAIFLIICVGAVFIFLTISKIYGKAYPVTISSTISSVVVNNSGAYVFLTVTLSKNSSYNSNVKFKSVYIINGSKCSITNYNLYNNLAILNIVCTFSNASNLTSAYEVDLRAIISTKVFLFPVTRGVNVSFIFEGSEVLPSTRVLNSNNYTSINNAKNYKSYNLLLYINPMNITYNYSINLPIYYECNNSLASLSINNTTISISNQNTQEYLNVNISFEKPNKPINETISCKIYTKFLDENVTLYTIIFNVTNYTKSEKIQIIPELNYYISSSSNNGYINLNLTIHSPEKMSIKNLELIIEPFNIVVGTWEYLTPFYDLNKTLMFTLNKSIVNIILNNITSKVVWIKGLLTYTVKNITDTYTFSKTFSYFEYYTNIKYNITPENASIKLYIASKCSKEINYTIKIINITYNISRLNYVFKNTNTTTIPCNTNKIIANLKINKTLANQLFNYLNKYHTIITYETIYLEVIEHNKQILKKYTVMLPIMMVPSNTTNTTNTTPSLIKS